MGKNFVLIGAAGYVAPRHMKAIKAVCGNLVAMFDPHDAVGVVDQYFPEALYFSEFERFDRFCERFTQKERIDYVSICSPNYLHSSHCLFALRIGADAICEKPLVLKERNLEQLLEAQERYGRKIWSILQLRLHPAALRAYEFFDLQKRRIDKTGELSFFEIDYVTSRGSWYQFSWKGNEEKSGGLIFNIGIHLIDFATSYFERVPDNIIIYSRSKQEVSGKLEYYKNPYKGSILFKLSTVGNRKRVFRYNSGNSDTRLNLDFTEGFDDLHTESYKGILTGAGFDMSEAWNGIKTCEMIRNRSMGNGLCQ